MIVIPAIDIRGGRAVRLTKGIASSETVYDDHPAEVAARFAAEGAAWLHVVDLDAALGTGANTEAVRELIRTAEVPVQLGGGLRSTAAVESALEMGAARVVLGTEAVRDPGFLEELASRFPGQVVAAIDTDGSDVLIRGWAEVAGPLARMVRMLEDAGATRFLATSVSRDGTLEGPDTGLYQRLGELTDAAVQASGGVATAEDIRALAKTSVEAVIVGKAFYEKTLTLGQAQEAAS